MPIKIRCDQCRLALTGKKAAKKHAQDTCHVWKPGYYCTVCGATWSKRSESKGHTARYHPDQGAPLTSLPVVAETSHAHTTSPSSARAQTQTSSPLPSSSTRPFGTVQVACYKCGERFGDAYALQTHRQIGCAGVRLARESDAHQDQAAHDDHEPDIAQEMCQICDTAFSDKNALDEHLSDNFTCKKCALHHASEEELQEHYQRESKLHPHCKTCGLAFENMATWAQHKARCPPAQPAAKEPSVSGCEDTARADVSGPIGSTQLVLETAAETPLDRDHTSDGDRRLKQPLNEDDLHSTAGESDSTREELVLRAAVSASASESSKDDPTTPIPHQVKDEQILAHADKPHWSQTSSMPKIRSKLVRCNQCKLVCENVGTLQKHANTTGHAHKPMYFCTVCLVTLNKIRDKKNHIRTTGHYPSTPAGLASATLASPPPSVSSFESISLQRIGHSESQPRLSGVSAAEPEVNREETRCVECDIRFPSTEALKAHYRQSIMHPTCYRCDLGFPSMAPFVEHSALLPPVGPSMGTRIKAKVAVARVVEPVPDSSVDKERTTRAAPNEDCATLEDSSGMRTLPFADSWSEQSSVTPTKPATPVTPKSQRLPSPTPSAAVSSHTHSSSETIAWQPLLDERRDRVSGEPARPDACSPTRSTSAAESNESAPNATECSVVPPTLPPDPAAHRSDGSPRKHPVLSYHCRVCLRDPCIEPVATICGHLFCHRCILEELMSRMGCPVCGKTFLVKLHVEL